MSYGWILITWMVFVVLLLIRQVHLSHIFPNQLFWQLGRGLYIYKWIYVWVYTLLDIYCELLYIYIQY